VQWTDYLAIAGIIVTTISSLTAGVVSVINALQNRQIKADTAEISENVNGHLATLIEAKTLPEEEAK
jgi:hypothetical protein